MVLAPRDAYEEDPVIFRYVRSYPAKTVVLSEGGAHQVGGIRVETPLRLKHPVETYGLRLVGATLTVSMIACTGYFPALETAYAGDVLILNVVFLPRRDDVHLCLEDAQRLVGAVRPRLAILTHFGMTMVRGKPWELAERVRQATGIKTIAARDHQRLDLAKALAG
jgi:phosphoribosyl 1,2-cyclic phosphodiesterase